MLLWLLSLLAASGSYAETGVVSASGSGRDASEAIAGLLRNTVAGHFRDQPAPLVRAILQAEILPNASSFVQSYKITEGGKTGPVSLSASVDLDVIQGLLSLTPRNIGESGEAKALVVMRGAKLPDAILSGLRAGVRVSDPFYVLIEGAGERFTRRGFAVAILGAEDLQAVGEGEEISSPELLRGLGAKAGARLAVGIASRYESYDNENSHSKETRLVLAATMVDVKAGSVVGRASVNVASPKSRKEQYLSDLQRGIMDESRDLFQELFVGAGRRLVKPESGSEFSVVRVQLPPSSAAVARFRSLMESVPGVRSVVELSVQRGKYDFAVRPAIPEAALAKAVAALQPADLLISPLQAVASEDEPNPPALVVKIATRELEVPAVTGGEPDAPK